MQQFYIGGFFVATFPVPDFNNPSCWLIAVGLSVAVLLFRFQSHLKLNTKCLGTALGGILVLNLLVYITQNL